MRKTEVGADGRRTKNHDNEKNKTTRKISKNDEEDKIYSAKTIMRRIPLILRHKRTITILMMIVVRQQHKESHTNKKVSTRGRIMVTTKKDPYT